MQDGQQRVELGQLVATPAALERAKEYRINVGELVWRHVHGDWGDLDAHDKRANEQALKSGARLLSAYGSGPTKLYVITEAATDACPACHGYGGACQPDKGEWLHGMHFRTDRPARRYSTTILRPEDY
jgi:hypothetical protein